MVPDETQALVDAEEAEAVGRFQRLAQLHEMVADASRRADAMLRLECSLSLSTSHASPVL